MSGMPGSDPQGDWAEMFSHDLKTVDEIGFPMSCSRCGMEFYDAETFLAMTTPACEDEGVSETYGQDGHRVVDVGRICPCGHLLVEEFKTRRDESLSGRLLRAAFSDRMKALRGRGTERNEARDALLGVLHERGPRAVIGLEIR